MNNLKVTLINPEELLFNVNNVFLIDCKKRRLELFRKIIRINEFDIKGLNKELNLNELLLNDYLRLN